MYRCARYDFGVKLIRRHHLAGIRYAVTVELAEGESPPAIGDTFSLGHMTAVRVVAFQDPSRQRPDADPHERSMTVEALEAIRRLQNIP